MEISKEELKEIIREVLREELANFLQPASALKPKASFQEVFDEIMAKVARGEMDQQQAGQAISAAYQVHNPEQNKAKLTQQYEHFTKQLSSWDSELEPMLGKGESPQDLLSRMKEKANTEDKELIEAMELKKLNEEIAKSEAERRLKEMKDQLSKKD